MPAQRDHSPEETEQIRYADIAPVLRGLMKNGIAAERVRGTPPGTSNVWTFNMADQDKPKQPTEWLQSVDEHGIEISLTATSLVQLERELIPLLNRIRKLQGKKPVHIPKD